MTKRPMSQREKWLLGLVLATLFFVGNLVLLRVLQTETLKARERLAEMKPVLAVSGYLLENKAYWLAARAWLVSQVAPMPNLNEARVRLLEVAQQQASTTGVQLSAENLPPASPEVDGFAEVRAGFEVRGDWASVVRFLVGLEDPAAFQGVADLKMVKTKEDEVKANVILVRFFPSPNLVASP